MTIFFPFPQPTVKGTFAGRPQRFLVNARLSGGAQVTAYCPNPGSFEKKLGYGSPVLLWISSDPLRKRPLTWRAVKPSRIWIGTDTHLANRLVEKAVLENRLPSLKGFCVAKREPRGTHGGKLDFLLTRRGRRCFVEVKSAMIAVDSTAQFPDSRSARACAQLAELAARATGGDRAVVIFVVQRGDVRALRINRAFDPDFAQAYDRAKNSGVEILAVKHSVSARGFGPPVIIPIIPAPSQ